VINRGNNRQSVFHDEGDYLAFLEAIADLKERKPFELYGYCLMGNHIHLLLRPDKNSVSRIVQSLLVSHTQRYHRFHRSSGHVWQGRFESPVIQDDEHLLTVLRYIEANPWRAKLVELPDSVVNTFPILRRKRRIITGTTGRCGGDVCRHPHV
jgi:putative transposase